MVDMKIKINKLEKLIHKTLLEQINIPELRQQQAATLIDATNIKNAETVLKLLARTTDGEISPEQKRLLDQLKGRTSKAVVISVLKQFYIDGLNGKPILGYRAMTPKNLKDYINQLPGTKADVGSEDLFALTPEQEQEDAETREYETQEKTGGDTLQAIADELGVSVQRAKQIYDKAMERFKARAATKGGIESGDHIRAFVLPAAKQFIEKLGEADSVEDFIVDVLKLSRATEKDIEKLVDLKLMVDEDMEEEAVADLIKLYLRGSPLRFIQKFSDVVRPSEKAGRPSATKRYF